MVERDILDIHGAADYLRLNEHTVGRLARAKEIPAFKIRSVWRFSRSSLMQWTKTQEVLARGRDVLVVDDEQFVRDSVSRTLRSEGFSVRVAAGGEEALELMRVQTPDLVLLDLKMPGMTGPEVMRYIRGEWGGLPIIILTGYPESDLVAEALRFAPITLLTKDTQPETIVMAVKAQLIQRSGLVPAAC